MAILQMEIDLGTVESAVALVYDVFHAQIVQRALQAVRWPFPTFSSVPM